MFWDEFRMNRPTRRTNKYSHCPQQQIGDLKSAPKVAADPPEPTKRQEEEAMDYHVAWCLVCERAVADPVRSLAVPGPTQETDFASAAIPGVDLLQRCVSTARRGAPRPAAGAGEPNRETLFRFRVSPEAPKAVGRRRGRRPGPAGDLK